MTDSQKNLLYEAKLFILWILNGFWNKDAPFVLLLFVLFFFLWSLRQTYNMNKYLSLESRSIQTQKCAPMQCTAWPRNVLFVCSPLNTLLWEWNHNQFKDFLHLPWVSISLFPDFAKFFPHIIRIRISFPQQELNTAKPCPYTILKPNISTTIWLGWGIFAYIQFF